MASFSDIIKAKGAAVRVSPWAGAPTDKDYMIVHWLDSDGGWRYATTDDKIVAHYARDRK